MKRNILSKLLIVSCLLVIVAGCKSKKQLVVNRNVPPVVKPNNGNTEKISAIRLKQLSFTTFSAKAKTDLTVNNDNNDCTLTIRINRDKKIWVSVTAILGVEIARAVITPDSLLLVNKFQGLYLKKPFSYVHKFTSRQIDFNTLQSLLVGNAIPKLLNDSTELQTVTPNINLSGMLDELLYKLVIGPDLRVTQTSLTNQAEQQSLQVTNNVFIQEAGKVVPSQIDIASVVKNQKIRVNLRYSKVEFDKPLEYPFSIPSSYSPAAD